MPALTQESADRAKPDYFNNKNVVEEPIEETIVEETKPNKKINESLEKVNESLGKVNESIEGVNESIDDVNDSLEEESIDENLNEEEESIDENLNEEEN